MEFEDYIKNFLIIGLFIIALVSFGTGLAANYGVSSSFIKTDVVDLSKVEQQMNETSTKANDWMTAFRSDNLFVQAGALVLLSVWGIEKLIIDPILTFFTLYFDIINHIFGIPPLVTGTLTALLIISLIFAAWKVLK